MTYLNLFNEEKELHGIFKNLLSSISNDYYVDLYLIDFKEAKGVDLSDREKFINNTIKKYREHHKDFQNEKLKSIIEYFHKIIINDTVIHFEDTLIYKELYKILFLIHNTFNAQTLLNDPKAYPAGFAEIQSDMKEVKVFRKHNRKNIIGTYRLHKNYRGQSRFRSWFTTIYIKNKTLAKFFTHIFLTTDLVKVKELYEDLETSKLLLNELEYILLQITSVSKVIKSFGILLYWEMIKYLKIHKDDAEVYTKSVIYELFKENFNSEELHKVIEIKSSLGFLPIFGASKNASLYCDDREFLYHRFFKEIQKDITITNEEFEPIFDSYIKTPHIQYLSKYPVELFRLNPKYSSID